MNWAWCSPEVRLAHLEAVARANGLHDVDCPLLRRNNAQRYTGAYIVPPDCDCWLADEDDG